jgi:hypothetical protein
MLWVISVEFSLSISCPHFKQRRVISWALLWFCMSLLNKCSSFNFSYLLLFRFSIHITSNFKQCTNIPSKFFLSNGIHKRSTGSLCLNHLLHVDPSLVLLPFVSVACFFTVVRSETARTGCPKILSFKKIYCYICVPSEDYYCWHTRHLQIAQ